MSKFAAQTIKDLMTSERDAGRVARKAQFIVAVEADDGSWCELDADNQGHAGVLARNMVENLNARGCSCWRVAFGGNLFPRSFYRCFKQYEVTE